MCFYWINDDQKLVVCNNSNYPGYFSNDRFLIGVEGEMCIANNRKFEDNAYLYTCYWTGVKQGIDGYPTKDKHVSYFIAGGTQN